MVRIYNALIWLRDRKKCVIIFIYIGINIMPIVSAIFVSFFMFTNISFAMKRSFVSSDEEHVDKKIRFDKGYHLPQELFQNIIKYISPDKTQFRLVSKCFCADFDGIFTAYTNLKRIHNINKGKGENFDLKAAAAALIELRNAEQALQEDSEVISAVFFEITFANALIAPEGKWVTLALMRIWEDRLPQEHSPQYLERILASPDMPPCFELLVATEDLAGKLIYAEADQKCSFASEYCRRKGADVEILAEEAFKLSAINIFSDAKQIYDMVFILNINLHEKYLHDAASVYILHKKYNEVIKIYLAIKAAGNEISTPFLFDVGLAYHYLMQTNEAVNCFNQVQIDTPIMSFSRQQLHICAIVYFNNKDYKESALCCDILFSDFGGYAMDSDYILSADSHLHLKNWRKAAKHYEKAISIDPKQEISIYAKAAFAHIKSDNIESAIERFNQVLSNPNIIKIELYPYLIEINESLLRMKIKDILEGQR